ncbi:hypothetical protein BDV93DRAFT_482949 [Ceratobasidium sp. AG-I]|nr:hypothetical protein BDV93DRAFT_482949 [Ceratobasidium sp. AG-I]
MSETAEQASTSPTLFLHVWPSQWNIPSFDPQCSAALMYMQLAFPGRYAIIECSDPDQSPSGQLPFLTHENIEVSPLPSIISYLESLARAESLSVNASIDAKLKSSQAQRDIAWKAYITSQLGDLLAHQLYVEHFWSFTRGALAKFMPIPQRWFVPNRLRQMHQPRLKAIGMWDAHYIEEPETVKPVTTTPQPPGVPPALVYKKAFARERLLERARATFQLLTDLLSSQDFIHGDSPTSLDIILAAHILPLLYIPFPNLVLAPELRSSFPELASHADRVLEHSQAEPAAPVLSAPTVRSSLSTVFQGWRKDMNVFAQEKDKGPAAQKEASMRYGKWVFGLLAGVGSVVYLIATGIVSFGSSEDEEIEITEEDLLGILGGEEDE